MLSTSPTPPHSEKTFQITIAKAWRGYQVRKHFLSPDICLASKKFLEQYPNLENFPRAPSGTAPVYFPPNLPVIFKQTEEIKRKTRWHTMRTMRNLCQKNGYKNLKIPLATPYKDWIIEEKLPIKELKQKGQIGLYCENREKFSAAVSQMTQLLCEVIYPDILTSIHPYQENGDIPLARYDNLMLFIQDGEGKIGLVDLEDVKIREHKITQQELLQTAQNALLLFPYHSFEILSVLRQQFPEIENHIDDLQQESNQIMTYYHKIYSAHLSFALETSLEQKKKFVSQELEADIQEAVSLKLNAPPSDVSQIIRGLIDQIEICISATPPPLATTSNIDHLLARTLSIPMQKVLSDLPFEDSSKSILEAVLQELIRRNKICYANIYLNYEKSTLIRIHY